MFVKIETMKTKVTIPVRVYRDEHFEEKTRIDLENARLTLQSCLDIWNGLDLIPINDICPLILNPQTVYVNAVNQLTEPPVTKGRFQISKSAFIAILDVPIPDSLYRICRDSRKLQFTITPELWRIENEKTVVMNQNEADVIIDSQNIYINDPDKVKLTQKLQDWIVLTNSLNEALAGQFLQPNPITNEFCRGKFKITDKYVGNNYQYEIAIDPEFLRYLLYSKIILSSSILEGTLKF